MFILYTRVRESTKWQPWQLDAHPPPSITIPDRSERRLIDGSAAPPALFVYNGLTDTKNIHKINI